MTTTDAICLRSALRDLRKAVKASPDDVAAASALADALEDQGLVAAAKRQRKAVALLVGRLDLQAKAKEIRARGLTARQEGKIRKLAGASRCPVEIVAGPGAPKELGEEGYHEFKGGGHCKYPGAAMRAGYRVEYVRSTRRVEVGDEWLVANPL